MSISLRRSFYPSKSAADGEPAALLGGGFCSDLRAADLRASDLRAGEATRPEIAAGPRACLYGIYAPLPEKYADTPQDVWFFMCQKGIRCALG
jgi:hypothetical protein